MTIEQGETDLEAAVRKLTKMTELLEAFFEEANGVPQLLTKAYKENSRLKIFAGLADLNYASSNAAGAIENLSKGKKGYDGVASLATKALNATRG